jgi:hypothetical protein
MNLPNAQHAIVDVAKLSDYCLNAKHPRGKSKARLFESLLGLRAEHAERLRQEILAAALSHEALEGEADEFGRRYTLDFQMTGVNKGVSVRTAWIIRTGEDFPRLTTCYIL